MPKRFSVSLPDDLAERFEAQVEAEVVALGVRFHGLQAHVLRKVIALGLQALEAHCTDAVQVAPISTGVVQQGASHTDAVQVAPMDVHTRAHEPTRRRIFSSSSSKEEEEIYGDVSTREKDATESDPRVSSLEERRAVRQIATAIVGKWRDLEKECSWMRPVVAVPWEAIQRAVREAPGEPEAAAWIVGLDELPSLGRAAAETLGLTSLGSAIGWSDTHELPKLWALANGDYEQRRDAKPATVTAITTGAATPKRWDTVPHIDNTITREVAERYCEAMRADSPGQWRKWYERAKSAASSGVTAGLSLPDLTLRMRTQWKAAQGFKGLLDPIVETACKAAFEEVHGEEVRHATA